MSDESILDALRTERDRLLLEAELSALRLNSGETPEPVVLREAFQDVVDPREAVYDMPGFGSPDGRVSLAEDRVKGDNRPFWQTEQEHALTRGIGRHLAQADGVASGALETLTNYVIGTGFEYDAVPLQDAVPEALADECDRLFTRFDDAFGWFGSYERELFQRLRRDGEAGLWIHHDQRQVVADIVEPEFVTEPDRPRDLEDYYGLDAALCWRYGIASEWNRPWRTHGAFVEFFGDRNDWEFVAEDQLVWAKINVDRTVKRGLSDFYAIYKDLSRAQKLLGNTLQGAAIQACIAYIREAAAGTKASDITALKGADYTYQRPTPTGSKTMSVRKFVPGTVIDTGGVTYKSGPLGGPQGPSYIPLVQAALRVVGARWSMPEYMISGDASNGNYASTLVAESPFTKSCQAKQTEMVRINTRLWWTVMACYCRLGYLRRFGIERVEDLRQAVELKITPPQVETRNRLEEHQIRKEQHEAGVLSSQTWAEEEGRDWDIEKERGAKPTDPFGASPVQPPAPFGLSESWRGYP